MTGADVANRTNLVAGLLAAGSRGRVQATGEGYRTWMSRAGAPVLCPMERGKREIELKEKES
jgi:hypothetical protein